MVSSSKTYVIELDLTEEDIRTLEEVASGEPWTISETVEKIVKSLTAGGMLVSPKSAERLLRLVESEEQLVEVVEQAKGRSGSGYLCSWRVDPAWMPAIEEVAEHRGWTVQQVIQEMMDYAMDQGWLMFIPEEMPRMRFTRGDFERLREITGLERPTGADIIRLLENRPRKA